jgi:PAS domain S-box-containing protein
LGKRAEMALRESETRFRTIFHDAPAGMLVLSAEWRFLQVNPAFSQFLGYSEQELLEKTIRDVTHPDDWEDTAKSIRAAVTATTRVSRFENRYVHASGKVLWGEVSVSSLQDAAGNHHCIAQVLDITGRKQAEQALRISEAKYRRLYESMRDAIVRVDMNGRIQEYNEVYQE